MERGDANGAVGRVGDKFELLLEANERGVRGGFGKRCRDGCRGEEEKARIPHVEQCN
jgi:hypothetical protein